MTQPLTQHEFEDLSAWMDGELDGPRAEEIRRRVETDPAWAEAARELVRLDDALDAWRAPDAPGDLPERIVANVRRAARPRVLRFRRVAIVASAAAAAIVLAVVITQRITPPPAPGPGDDVAGNNAPRADAPEDPAPGEPGGEIVAAALDDVPPSDRFVVENLGFFQSYDTAAVLAENDELLDSDTLAALERLDG
jgi:hypothetical protein